MNNIFDNLYTGDFLTLKSHLENSLLKDQKEFIITANSEIYSSNNKEVMDILSCKDNIIVCDGIALTKISSKKKRKKYQRIPGIELTYYLLDIANKNSLKVYIYGSSSDNVIKLNNVLSNKYSNIKLLGLKDGFINNAEDVKEDIIKQQPDIVLVALGVPKQELFINSIIDKCDKGLFIGVGGSLDIISGLKKRAPKIMINMHLEWLYRICKEPKRFYKFIRTNIIFISKVRNLK